MKRYSDSSVRDSQNVIKWHLRREEMVTNLSYSVIVVAYPSSKKNIFFWRKTCPREFTEPAFLGERLLSNVTYVRDAILTLVVLLFFDWIIRFGNW